MVKRTPKDKIRNYIQRRGCIENTAEDEAKTTEML